MQWVVHDDEIDFEVVSSVNGAGTGWVGIGFSSTPSMV